jgi:peptidoglycan hydrolase-like protein with peptidoglycan-binding domain
MSARIEMLPPNTPQCSRVLHKGMKGDDVQWMQELLIDLNDFYKFCPMKTPFTATGYFGDETARLLKFFQYRENLVPDSHFDRATCNRLNYRYNDYIDIRSRVGFEKYKTSEEYLNSRFGE